MESQEEYDSGTFKLNIFRPIPRSEDALKDRKLPVFFWFHGGGFVLDLTEEDHPFCTRICNVADCVVVNVEYRLAPQHTFPTAHEDAWDGEQSTEQWQTGEGSRMQPSNTWWTTPTSWASTLLRSR